MAFNLTAKVLTYSPGNTSALYYSKQEHNRFKRGIKALCIAAKERPQVRSSGALLPLSHDTMPVLDRDGEAAESLRGLEHWLFCTRAQNTRLAQRSLLKYQALLQSEPGMTRERQRLALAIASAKINAWSAAVAAETARRDAMRACEGEYAIPTDARSVADMDALPFLFEKIRQQRCPGSGQDHLECASQRTKRRKIE